MLASDVQNGATPRHALSVDVEDWYHDGQLPVADDSLRRVEPNMLQILDLLAERGAKATFFFVAELAEQYPSLVRRVVEAGHEIGSHGYDHRHLSQMLWREFREDARRSRRVLEDVSGCAIRGYRAPYFSIKADVQWPIDVLAEAGFDYDSSILPIDRPPGFELVCPRAPFRHRNGLWEVPVATLQMFFIWHLPIASGAGLRMVPPALLRRYVEKFERDVGAGVFYLHPWELDPASPTRTVSNRWWLRVGRQHLRERLRGLLSERSFGRIDEVFPQVSRASGEQEAVEADVVA